MPGIINGNGRPLNCAKKIEIACGIGDGAGITDLSGFDPALVDLYRDGDGLYGIPFAVFPSVMYYNSSLFDEAGAGAPGAGVGVEGARRGEAARVTW